MSNVVRRRPVDVAFVDHWSARYPGSAVEVEQRLFTEVRASIAVAGYLTRQQLLDIGRWKSNRSTGYLGRNSEDDVRDVTRLALSAPERLKHKVLCLLNGVQVPVASAILTVADPDRYTVLDRRAVETLQAHGELSGWPRYVDYLTLCRQLSSRVRRDLRTLDRALWQWSRTNDSNTPDGLETA